MEELVLKPILLIPKSDTLSRTSKLLKTRIKKSYNSKSCFMRCLREEKQMISKDFYSFRKYGGKTFCNVLY